LTCTIIYKVLFLSEELVLLKSLDVQGSWEDGKFVLEKFLYIIVAKNVQIFYMDLIFLNSL